MTPGQAKEGGVVRSNSATLYSSAWLDLSVEPVVLEFHHRSPAGTTTFNWHVDYYQRNENLSNATVGRAGGAYGFVGPCWKGPLPDGVHRIDVATDTEWIVGRLEVNGTSDVGVVNAIQDQLSLTSLTECVAGRATRLDTVGENQYEVWPPYEMSGATELSSSC